MHLVDRRKVLLKGDGQPVDETALVQLPGGMAQEGSIRVPSAGGENAHCPLLVVVQRISGTVLRTQLVTQMLIYVM